MRSCNVCKMPSNSSFKECSCYKTASSFTYRRKQRLGFMFSPIGLFPLKCRGPLISHTFIPEVLLTPKSTDRVQFFFFSKAMLPPVEQRTTVQELSGEEQARSATSRRAPQPISPAGGSASRGLITSQGLTVWSSL